jgi:hypothetical protein
MINEVAAGRNLLTVIEKYPTEFRSLNRTTNTKRAKRWYANRAKILDYQGFHRATRYAQKRRIVKTKHVVSYGRGPKRQEWVTWIYGELLEEFRRLMRAGVPLNSQLLMDMGKALILESTHPKFNKDTTTGKKQKKIVDCITKSWVQHFRGVNNVIWRSPKGRLMMSPKKELEIAQRIAYHLGELKRRFESRELVAAQQSNMDETHMLYAMKTQKMLSFKGESLVKYMDVVRGTEGISACITIIGGDKNARIGVPMLIFINANRSYPIRGKENKDDVEGACYRTAPRGFMEGRLLKQYLQEERRNRKKHVTYGWTIVQVIISTTETKLLKH